jgi:hypothetical protein
MATATIVVRRALGSSRDVRLAGDALRAAGMAPGPALAAALASDAWGVVLVALRGEHPCGVLVLRFLRAPGDAHDGPVSLALVDVLDGDPDTREVLLAAARAEAEGRDAARFVVDAPPLRRAAPVGDRVVLTLAPGVTATVDPSVQAPETSTLWSGAMAFRTRWRNDRVAPGWSVEGCLGTPDDDGDALRFDASTRMLREVYLARPTRLRIDEAVLARAMAAPSLVGVLRLDEATPFVLPPMDDALFDVSLDGFVALRDGLDAHGLVAVAASPHLHLLFAEGTYAGWRVCDPVAHARPMGWPEARDAEPPSPARVEALRALLYDWMVIDASARVDPTTSESPEDVVHMVALRDRALALAAGDDVVAAVARDVASHTHWSWGFYRLGP